MKDIPRETVKVGWPSKLSSSGDYHKEGEVMPKKKPKKKKKY